MTRRGRAGAALTVAAVGSFVAGTASVILLMLVAPALADLAVRFGPPEFFAITAFALMALSRLTGGSLPLVVMLVGLGLALTTVGQDVTFGKARFTFGAVQLLQGVELVAVAVGLFGVTEVLIVAEERATLLRLAPLRMRELLPTRDEWQRSIGAMVRGTALGFLSTFASYALERRVSRRREEFGQGAIEGVAGPESANNAAAGGGMVPLLALGVPSPRPRRCCSERSPCTASSRDRSSRPSTRTSSGD